MKFYNLASSFRFVFVKMLRNSCHIVAISKTMFLIFFESHLDKVISHFSYHLLTNYLALFDD